MSLKEKLQEKSKEIEKLEKKELAKKQKEDYKNIAFEGFARFGIRDLIENKSFRLIVIGLVVFAAVFFTFAFIYYQVALTA